MQTSMALQQVTDQLYHALQQSTLKHWLEDRKVSQHLDEKIRTWAYQAKSNLDEQHPYQQVGQQLVAWQQIEHITQPLFSQMFQEYQQFMQLLGMPDLTTLWQAQFQTMTMTNASMLSTQFQLVKEKWQRQLTEAVAQWEFEQLALQRDAFLDEIKDFLATLQKMAKHKDSVGLETGILLDYSAGKLTAQDTAQFEEWCDYLEKDTELLRLCKMIGNAQPTHVKRRRIHRKKEQVSQDHVSVNALQSQEEIVGIQLARELSLALPSERALLSDPELELLFDLKYLESNLMSLHMQGQQTGRILEDPHQYTQPHSQKGPMIVCLDTSGSMHGQPELIAKAITLYLAIQGMKSKRAVYLINFSTDLTILELQKKTALDDVIHFLSQSFHGGTDLLPALEHSLTILDRPDFVQADLVVISDFIMGHLPEMLMLGIEQQQQQGTGFYAVAIANLRFEHLNQGLFDHQWIYQAKTGQVLSLNTNG